MRETLIFTGQLTVVFAENTFPSTNSFGMMVPRLGANGAVFSLYVPLSHVEYLAVSFNIVDRRKVAREKTSSNRQRFLKRVKDAIKEQIPDIIKNRGLKDLDKQGADIKVNRKNLKEPTLHHSGEGIWDIVRPGNDRFIPGDVIYHPQKDSEGGGHDGEDGVDDFIVQLSREEFMDAFFEGLALPDLVKKELSAEVEFKKSNAGYQTDGSPARLHLVKSYLNSFVRRQVLTADLREQLKQETDVVRKEELQAEIDKLPLFEDIDLRYRSSKWDPVPSTHATVIMLMDVSASMGEAEKTLSRKFFWLLYAFLKRSYEHVDLIFVAHTTSAKIMEEQEFFETRLSGGTLVSAGLEVVAKLIKERAGKTNIYVAQATDGDNSETDNGTCSEILEDDILPGCQYYAYLQIKNKATQDLGLWRSFEKVAQTHKKLQMKEILHEKEIFQIFRELFNREKKQTSV